MSCTYSIAECITRWGNSASIALMDPACQIFSTDKVPGIIGYKLEAKHVIVFGDPLCAPEHVNTITDAFHDHFQDSVKNIIYVAATEKFTQSSLETHCNAAIGIGREIILDPTRDPRAESGNKASLLRRNCKQAIKHGVSVCEYTEQDPALEQTMNELGEAWSKNRQGLQVYLQDVNIFSHRECKRFFYAKQNNNIIGVLILNRLDAYQGWVISFSLVDRLAPHGTSDLLIVSALEALAKDNCHFFAIGTVPIPSIDSIYGLNPLSTWCVQRAYRCALRMFHLSERERYWKKFCPTSQSTYLILGKPKLGVSGALGLMSALNATSNRG